MCFGDIMMCVLSHLGVCDRTLSLRRLKIVPTLSWSAPRFWTCRTWKPLKISASPTSCMPLYPQYLAIILRRIDTARSSHVRPTQKPREQQGSLFDSLLAAFQTQTQVLARLRLPSSSFGHAPRLSGPYTTPCVLKPWSGRSPQQEKSNFVPEHVS